ncbi:MAG: c-type cytochrome [Planctomycetes bacterium]|nr:c-type cytochrome [Planctomycetota bacterium]
MRSIVAAVGLLIIANPALPQALKVPPGFEVVEFADGKLANDIHVMTIDPKGRVVVAGRGYIRILIDDDGDGKADRALDFASSPKDGAMGLLWEGDTLFVMGDGGLRRFKSKNGDKADGPSELIRTMKTGGEHTSHAIQRGPDGWLYVLCGNTAGIDKSYAELPTSPVKEPIAGCVLRFHPDRRPHAPREEKPHAERDAYGVGKCEIVAHGFRNPYAFDFNLAGDLFTFDADNERCVSLPWYEPTRFYHVIDGRHYGWLNPQHAVTWRRPPYFCDVVAPIATLGRGSPTGVACYRHNQFPPEYHGGFFLCDWTFGKIHFAELERKGASYTAKTRVFLESLGDNGFAPTACAVDPKTGDLYVSIGGRGTRGAVYRIRHRPRFKAMAGKLATLKMAKRSLDMTDEYEQMLKSKEAAHHLQALLIARRHTALGDFQSASPLGKHLPHFDDLHIRQAQADLIRDRLRGASPRHKEAFDNAVRKAGLDWSMIFGLGMLQHDRLATLGRGLFLLEESKNRGQRLEGIRLVQLGLGDIGSKKAIGTIWEGYTPRIDVTDAATARKLANLVSTRGGDLDFELARTLAILGPDDPGVRALLLTLCGPNSGPIERIHYLACYARIGGKRFDDTEAKLVARALLDLDRAILSGKRQRESNWALRVRELYIGLAEKDPALHQAMVEHPDFGRPDHALFANTEGFPKEKAARIFLERWRRGKDYALNGNIVQLFDALPADDVLPTIRKRWGETGQENALLPLLAKKPIASDRRKFIDGLNLPQSAVVVACLDGLQRLDGKCDAEETFALIRALHRSQSDARKPAPYGARLAGRLQKITGQSFGSDSKRWIAWLEKEHPTFGKRLANPDGVDVAKWDARLAKLEWNGGNADTGKTVFHKASCTTCHSGSQAIGPDLAGVASRFSRADLLTAILQPSKDVPARYQTTVVETKDGKTYQGIVIYDAVDNLMLQTGASITVRMDGASVVSRHVSAQSLMPAGLLDPLSDREIVDLYAYLRSIK